MKPDHATDLVLIEQTPTNWTFVLNRPDKRNALNAAMIEALLEGVDQAHASEVPMLTFTGRGKSFCAGFDFTDVDAQSEGDLLWRFIRIEQLLQRIYRSPALTLGLAHGKNFGAGVDLLLACQHRVSEPDATFRMPGLQFGLVLGTRRLGHLIGFDQARRLQEIAATVDAPRARSLGMLTELTDVAQWPECQAALSQTAANLDRPTRGLLSEALLAPGDEQDMAALVRAVVRPGLKARIAKYRARE